VKLLPQLFNDSIICKQIRCGRTKAEKMIENVSAPYSIERHSEKLIKSNQKFSVANDASNKNNIKLFPILIQYYNSNDGMQQFVLDFYEDASETSSA